MKRLTTSLPGLRLSWLWCFGICSFLFFVPLSSLGQDKEITRINTATQTWSAFQRNVQLKNLQFSGSTAMSGTAVLFGHSTDVVVDFTSTKRKRVRTITINLPQSAKVTSAHFSSIIGKEFDAIMPTGTDIDLALTAFTINFKDSRKNPVTGASLSFDFGIWKPFGNGSQAQVSNLKGTFGLSGMSSGQTDVNASLTSTFQVPDDLASAFKIGQTQLSATGSINSATGMVRFEAGLQSQKIPLVTDESIVLTHAKFILAYQSGKAKLALGGGMVVQENGKAVMPEMNGEVSIDVTGNVYAQGWMSQGKRWTNPFNLGKNIHVTGMGLGFGANFKTTPIPTPKMAMQGGIIVTNPQNGNASFSGKLTLAADFGDPTQKVIDASLDRISLADVIGAFHPGGVPAGFRKELKKIDISNFHFTQVPPGPGVSIFGTHYPPGFMAHGAMSYGKQRGAMYVKRDIKGMDAYAQISAIRTKGFSLTSATNSSQGPSLMFSVKPNSTQASFALSGKLTVLNISALTDIYLSDYGFNATVEGNVLGYFKAGVDVAGAAIDNSASMYVGAYFKAEDNLATKISEEASREIHRVADELQAAYDQAGRELEGLRPKMNTAKSNLEAKQAQTRQVWEKQCALVNQREEQDAGRKRKEAKKAELQAEIQRLKSDLETNRHRPATKVRSTVCPGNSKKAQKYCWTPRSGYKWDIMYPIAGPNATFKPRQTLHANAEVVGTFKAPKKCQTGDWGDAKLAGNCYKCPSGYKRNGVTNKCIKVIPIQRAPAVKGAYAGCGDGRTFADIGTNACWECPQGYNRKVSTFPVTGPKACALIDLQARLNKINAKKLELAGVVTDLELINKGIGELATQLTGVASSVCDDMKNTEIINLDPAVAPAFAEWSGLSLAVNEAQKVITTIGTTQVGALRAAAWVTEHGGKALGVVDVREARFEGCLSTVSGGTVALNVNGSFAGAPMDASFKINLNDPTKDIKRFANSLLLNSNPKTTHSNGNCKKPNVPRPTIDNAKIQELMRYVEEGKKLPIPDQAPKPQTKPAWAPKERLTQQ